MPSVQTDLASSRGSGYHRNGCPLGQFRSFSQRAARGKKTRSSLVRADARGAPGRRADPRRGPRPLPAPNRQITLPLASSNRRSPWFPARPLLKNRIQGRPIVLFHGVGKRAIAAGGKQECRDHVQLVLVSRPCGTQVSPHPSLHLTHPDAAQVLGTEGQQGSWPPESPRWRQSSAKPNAHSALPARHTRAVKPQRNARVFPQKVGKAGHPPPIAWCSARNRPPPECEKWRNSTQIILLSLSFSPRGWQRNPFPRPATESELGWLPGL